MKSQNTHFFTWLTVMAAFFFASLAHAENDYYTSEKVFSFRPKPEAPRNFGHIGPTGIIAHIEKGVEVVIEGSREGSPAAGKVEDGEVILAVNGNPLKGLNPYVVLGSAITEAEASDGKMVFDLESEAGKQRKVTIQIPVLGAYGENWPVDCPKSLKIVENAAAYYSKSVSESNDLGVGNALSCLFLLSTGDDAYLPVVRKHYQKFIDKPESVGDHTWNNGYNGIACAEYYFRTGDKDILPVLQAFCDDARERQNFNSAWKHWGPTINPGYVAGGLMNPASTQVLTTLLLSKEAGVDVDEKTLLNALRYFYRFAGHGSVAYGDHRGEGGVSSNGKDAMLAVGMQIASDANGDTSVYQSARDWLSMATLNAYPGMITGHADNGRGDGIWRGLVSSYMMEKKPDYYREVMDKITWWYDLSRYENGAMGLATLKSFNDPGSGAGAAMTFTAPMKTLRITGAPRSKYAKDFKLPERIWGNEADLAFHRIDPAADYQKYGEFLPIHKIVPLIGSAYIKGSVEVDPESVSLEQLQQFVRHDSYMIRTQAAKALRIKEEFTTIEELLRNPDPRLRRAAIDGIIDWRYFFATGKQPLKAEQFTPAMIELITAMLSDPDEATYVVEGALFAAGFMPTEVIQKHAAAIMPWTKHEDWWFRHASFMALQGMERDPALYLKAAPILTEIMIRENHTMPRQGMNHALAQSLKKFGPESDIGAILTKGFNEAVAETRILEGNRDREGKFNIINAIGQAAGMAPQTGPQLAAMLVERGLPKLDDDELLQVVSGGRGFGGFLKLSAQLKGDSKKNLESALYEHFRPELSKRLKAGGGTDINTIDAILGIIALRKPNGGWQSIGSPEREERVWQYVSFDPVAEKDIRPKREGRRYRQISLEPKFEGWYKPDYKAWGWQSGQAPIGKGSHPRGPKTLEHRSLWGKGEILLARTSFELETDPNYDLYRLRMICIQGFDVYLNGKKIHSYSWWASPGEDRKWPMSDHDAGLLKKGTNTIAVYTMAVYPSEQKAHWKEKVFGHFDCYIEGLNKDDLY